MLSSRSSRIRIRPQRTTNRNSPIQEQSYSASGSKSAICAVTTNSSLLHDFRDSSPYIDYMGYAETQVRRIAAGVLCATALVLSPAVQAQVAEDPQVDDLAKRCCVFPLHLDETPVLVIDLPWARSRKATALSPREIETGSALLVDLLGYMALHSACPLEHERKRPTWTMSEIRRISWAGGLLCLADRHGASPQCWKNDVTRLFQVEAYRMGISPPGTWAD